MLEFVAFNESTGQTKKFKAVNMNTIYNQYKAYCSKKEFRVLLRVPLTRSYGGVAWSDGGQVISLKQVK
jgi:hypothetical protein